MSDDLAQVRATLAALATELAEVTAAVDRLAQDAPRDADRTDSAAAGEPSYMTPPTSEARPAVPPAPTEPPWPTPPGAIVSPQPGVPAQPVMPAQSVPGQPVPAEPAAWSAAPPQAVQPASPPPMHAAAPQPSPMPPVTAPPPPRAAYPEDKQSSWADTAGLKILGWVGGGITVLGIVMLLVIAAQQGYFGPMARVILGLVLGIVLIGGGYLLHRRPDHTALAVTVVCTGLAVEYLTTVGAVRTAELFPPLVGHIASVVIVAVAVALAVAWQRPWLAAVSFAVSALLAPVVGGGFTLDVYIFEAVMVAGGAVALLTSMGIIAWAGAAVGAGFAVFIGEISQPVTPGALWLILVMGLGAWAVLLGRWIAGRAPVDPGVFPIRQRSTDPAQIARDYADFHAHQQRADLARSDRAVAVGSLGGAAVLMALALGLAEPAGHRDIAVGIVGAVLAVLAGATAWAIGRDERFSHPSVRVVAWVAAIIFAGVSLLRLLEGDVRSVSWMVLAAVILVIVGVERMTSMLIPALSTAVIALLASGPALRPGDLFDWPSIGLISNGTVLIRSWTVVLPAGICVVVLAATAWWATSRVTAATVDRLRTAQSERQAAGMSYGYPTQDLATAQRARTSYMGWTLICCAIVACYGLLAVTMVLSYAVSPTFAGYQVGQIVVTGIVTVAALLLLWQGFRSMLLRLGGLGLAAVAVGKLLFFDTRTLESVPRAVTVIGVGVLLLVGAVIYVTSLGRARKQPDSAILAGAGAETGGFQASKPAND